MGDKKEELFMKKSNLLTIALLTLFIFVLPVLSQESKKDKSDWPVLKGPYLGQKSPGMTPEVFAPGIISKPDYHEHSSLSFTKDREEIYWSAQCLYEGESNQRIFFMKLKDGRWTSPKILQGALR